MKDKDLTLLRRIGLAIGFAFLAGGFATAIGGSRGDAPTLAALGGALVGFFITPFPKKEVEKD